MSTFSASQSTNRWQQQAVLTEHRGVNMRLTHYPPHHRHSQHSHRYAQISFLLSGCFQETGDSRKIDIVGNAVGFKPANYEHADVFGPDGCLILSINIQPDAMNSLGINTAPQHWRCNQAWNPAILINLLSCGNLLKRFAHLFAGNQKNAYGFDRHSSPPPDWLKHCRQVMDQHQKPVEVSQLAELTGIHRVVISRMFRRYYGISPTEYRQRRRVAHAVNDCINSNTSFVQIAANSGFSDQAHFCREIRRFVGMTPASMRKLMAV